MSQMSKKGPQPLSAAESSAVRLDRNTAMALSRTVLAYQRTLMAWIRTSASLISFGFTIYKFFEYLREAENVNPAAHLGRFGPRRFGMAMIFIGFSALILAVLEYRHGMNALEEEYGPFRRSMTGVIAGLVAVFGMGLLLVVWFRL
jgi:putative membrane protein